MLTNSVNIMQIFNSKNAAKIERHEQIEAEVNQKINELKGSKFEINLTNSQIEYAINQLNKGKAFGYDSVTAEMLIFSKSEKLKTTLNWFYTCIINFGIIPTNFNVSMVTPIPKGKVSPQKPADFRPISVSTAFANLFELLLLFNGAKNLMEMHPNQFGYQNNLSCKHAYFVINEGINYYNSCKMKVELAQLDAEKAFDTLWRIGLYHKLIPEIELPYFRALVNYYEMSNIIVKYKGKQSQMIRTVDGCKQGGILSGYLFNFMNELLQQCVNLNIGCELGEQNISIIAYCDDLFLMASTKQEMDVLLEAIGEYALNWKIKFNTNKCFNLSIKPPDVKNKTIPKLYLNNCPLVQRSSIIHLGLPIGSANFIKDYWIEQLKSTVRSFYALNGIGLRPFEMTPLTMAKIYRIYCQPKFLYGLEMIYISKGTLKKLNTTQSTLIKMNLGLSKYARSSALLDALRIESVKHLYYKFKIIFISQLKKIPFTNTLLECPDQSFIGQVIDTNRLLGINILQTPMKQTLETLKAFFQTTCDEVKVKIINISTMMSENKQQSWFYRDILAKLLYN